MNNKDQKGNDFWERFDEWKEKWKKDRDADRLNAARELRDAEEDYERYAHSLNPFEPRPKPRDILGTQAGDPSINRIPLKDPQPCRITMPALIDHIDSPSKAETLVYFRIGEEAAEKILEQATFQIKKIIEHIIGGRFMFFMQPKGIDSFLIIKAIDKDAPPFFEITLSLPNGIRIKALEEAMTWSHGHIFDCYEILRLIVERLKKMT
ncbi:hypothetical protein JXL19_08765 [bacterium]|nr:hypothetical protein [bacterium]